MNTPFTLALAQFEPTRGDIAVNLQQHLRLIALAHCHHAHVVVFPELSLTGYELDLAAKLAGDLDDNVWQALQQEAEQTRMSLVVGAPIHAQQNKLPDLPTPKPVIASILLHPLLPPTFYAKMHLHQGESHFVDAGNQHLLWQVQQHNLALAICADSTHPLHAPACRQRAASMYLASVLISHAGYAQDAALLQHHARDLHMGVGMANFVGHSGGWHCAGQSAFWDETGQLIAQAPCDASGILLLTEQAHGWQSQFLPLF